MRLAQLQATVARLDQILDEDENIARLLVQVWRNEHNDSVPSETRFHLARGVHAGNPEAVAEMENVVRLESVHVRSRAVEWIEELPTMQRERWRRIFGL